MEDTKIFENFNQNEIEEILKTLKCRKIEFKKGMTIMSNLKKSNEIGIVLDGNISLVRIDFYGNQSNVTTYLKGDMFGGKFSDDSNEELSIIANSNCLILFSDYDLLVKGQFNYPWGKQLTMNIVEQLVDKINNYNSRIEVLTKKTIREKLLEYFHILEKKESSSTFTLPMSLTALSEYLAVDRSAMQRELKNLKMEQIIETNGKKVTLIYR